MKFFQRSGAGVTFLALLSVLALAVGFFCAAAYADTGKVDKSATAMIVIEVDSTPSVIIFLDNTGRYAAVAFKACDADPDCSATAISLLKAKQYDRLNIHTDGAKQPDTKTYFTDPLNPAGSTPQTCDSI